MDQEEKPPAPPLRLTSNIGGFNVSLPVDLRPLPKEPEEKNKHSKSKLKKNYYCMYRLNPLKLNSFTMKKQSLF